MEVLLILNVLATASCIFMIVILYLRQNRLMETEKNNKKIQSELEELFTSYLLEMKEENDSFLRKVKNLVDEKIENHDKPYEQTTKPATELTEEVPPPLKNIQMLSAKKAYKKVKKDPNTEEKDRLNEKVKGENELHSMNTVLKEALKLQNEGLSIDEIAKQLNKGKTEIELLLKFSQVERTDT
jgi:uncharacterized membrane-anchored protein YhcB (DUF1043 family)